MRLHSLLALFLVAALLPFSIKAQDACGSIKSAQDILHCALGNHPEVKLSESSLKRDELLKSMAKQVPNPEFEGSVLSGQPGAPEGVFIDAGITQAIELGGKRKNRIKQAIATERLTQAQVLESKELTALNTVLALYRLRQIKNELAVSNEADSTYQRIVSNYTLHPKLAPEQEVSSSVFNLAQDEIKLKKASLLQEQSSLLQFLTLATGLSDKQILSQLPSGKNNWPTFSVGKDQETLNSELAKANADKAMSEANLKLAKSNAWPDFKLGPSFQTQTEIAGQNSSAGITFGLGIPLFSHNKGGIEYAKRDHAKSVLLQQIISEKNKSERIKQIERYNQTIKILQQIKSVSFVNKGHDNLEKYFAEGLISAPLVIETHRQLIELTESKNIQELNAIDALWRLYILDGKILEAKL